MNEISGSWQWIGFSGKPEPGFDYSWVEVQRGLLFVGSENCIKNCILYNSTKNPTIFLVKNDNGLEEVWDTYNLEFSLLGPNRDIIVASRNDKLIHLSGISYSLINILIKQSKLPHDSLDNDLNG